MFTLSHWLKASHVSCHFHLIHGHAHCCLISLLPCLFLLPAQLHFPPLPASHHDGQGLHELPPVPLRQRELRHSGRLHARHTRITSKEHAPIHSVKNGILQNTCSSSLRMDADLGKNALLRIARWKNSPAKGQKKNGDKSAVAMLQITRQLSCAIQHMEPPKSSSILRQSSNIRKPIRCVRFTKAVVRHANIRDKNPSLGMICPGDPHQRNPNAPKFEDRSQEETEWQERCAREAAWRLAKRVFKLKEQQRAAFFSPSENRCLPAPSTLKPEEREFVVDSRASMHMISKKNLNSVEMDTLTKSCSPTIVVTVNGEVQTHEEATVYLLRLLSRKTLPHPCTTKSIQNRSLQPAPELQCSSTWHPRL